MAIFSCLLHFPSPGGACLELQCNTRSQVPANALLRSASQPERQTKLPKIRRPKNGTAFERAGKRHTRFSYYLPFSHRPSITGRKVLCCNGRSINESFAIRSGTALYVRLFALVLSIHRRMDVKRRADGRGL